VSLSVYARSLVFAVGSLSTYCSPENTRPALIESAIPEIVGLALDDKHSEIWRPAVRLLTALSASLEGE
jgi:hypothetical protein